MFPFNLLWGMVNDEIWAFQKEREWEREVNKISILIFGGEKLEKSISEILEV